MYKYFAFYRPALTVQYVALRIVYESACTGSVGR